MVLMKCKNDGICVSDTSTAGTIAACQEQPKSSEFAGWFVNMYIPMRHLHNCKQLLHLIDKSLKTGESVACPGIMQNDILGGCTPQLTVMKITYGLSQCGYQRKKKQLNALNLN